MEVPKESVYISIDAVLCPSCFTKTKCIIGTGTYITAHCTNPECEKVWWLTISVGEVELANTEQSP